MQGYLARRLSTLRCPYGPDEPRSQFPLHTLRLFAVKTPSMMKMRRTKTTSPSLNSRLADAVAFFLRVFAPSREILIPPLRRTRPQYQTQGRGAHHGDRPLRSHSTKPSGEASIRDSLLHQAIHLLRRVRLPGTQAANFDSPGLFRSQVK